MNQNTREIELTCPFCGAVKNLNIPESIFSQKKFGSIKIQVPAGAICSNHTFIVFFNNKGHIVGYEKIDLQMGQIDNQKQNEKTRSIKGLIDVFGIYGLLSLMHAIIFNYQIYIIAENDDFYKKIQNIKLLMEDFLEEKYRNVHSMEILRESDLNQIKLKNKNSLVIDSHKNILQTPWEEKLKFEESIVSKAIDIISYEEQMLLIQQNVDKFIKISEETKKILDNVDKIYEEELIDRLSKNLMSPKISNTQLILIKKFISNRISADIANKIKNRAQDLFKIL